MASIHCPPGAIGQWRAWAIQGLRSYLTQNPAFTVRIVNSACNRQPVLPITEVRQSKNAPVVPLPASKISVTWASTQTRTTWQGNTEMLSIVNQPQQNASPAWAVEVVRNPHLDVARVSLRHACISCFQ